MSTPTRRTVAKGTAAFAGLAAVQASRGTLSAQAAALGTSSRQLQLQVFPCSLPLSAKSRPRRLLGRRT